jgi:hypothetical protein
MTKPILIGQKQNNDHLNFDCWYENLDTLWDYDKFNGWESAVVDENLLDIFGIFDHFTKCPANLYYDEKTNQNYPICVRRAYFKTFQEMREKLPLYRSEEKFKKLILYSIEKNKHTSQYSVRFAGFPDNCIGSTCPLDIT